MSVPLTEKLKVLFPVEQDQDGYPPVSVEGIWVCLQCDIGLVDNIPFYVYGIGPGDQISVKTINNEVWFDQLLKSAGASVFRVIVKDYGEIQNVRTALLDLGCPSEVDAKMGLIAVEIPVGANITPILDFLMTGQETGRFDFEEGVLRHDLPN